MKNPSILFLSIICLIGISLGSSCNEPSTTSNNTEVFGDTLQLNYQETLLFPNDVALSFQSINDSRCPIDAVCFWQGVAEVGLNLSTQSGGTTDFIMSYLGLCEENCCSPEEVGNYKIELLEVLPYPDLSGIPVTIEDYTITIIVTEI